MSDNSKITIKIPVFKTAVAAVTVALLVIGGAVYTFKSTQALTLTTGSLIKGTSYPAVYFYASNGKRYVYTHQKNFNTWYKDFSGVQIITDTELAAISLGGNITYRAGTRLIKIQSDPKTYAVEPGGKLRWVTSEAIASTLWGASWAQRIDDVSDAFFTNYAVAADLNTYAYPSGSLVKTAASSDIYYIDGASKRKLTGAAFTANGFRSEFVVTIPQSMEGWLSGLSAGSDIAGAEAKLTDAAQLTPAAAPSCGVSQTSCAGGCADLSSDSVNCGSCGNVCGSGQRCSNSVCVNVQTTTCYGGTTDCSGSCVDTQTNASNCGACGAVCSQPQNATAVCTTGACGYNCNTSYTKCSGSCVDTQTNASNCGACGAVCSQPQNATAVCTTGACGFGCNTGYTKCGSSCIDPQTDPLNCGSCANPCAGKTNGYPTCTSGACGFGCNTGYTKCGSSCIDPQTDPLNCGSCGNVCPQNKTCQSGTCV